MTRSRRSSMRCSVGTVAPSRVESAGNAECVRPGGGRAAAGASLEISVLSLTGPAAVSCVHHTSQQVISSLLVRVWVRV